MSEKKTHVKPYERRNKKKDGKHRVQGHSRSLPSKKGTVDPVEPTRDTIMGGSQMGEGEWDTSSGSYKVNEEDFSNPRLIIDVGKDYVSGKHLSSQKLTVRTPDGDEIKRIPSKIKSLAGGNYKTDKKGDNRFWRYNPEAPQDIEYFLDNFARSDKYRLVRYRVFDSDARDEWFLEVEKVD